MGAGMDKILPGLFVGSLRDSKDPEQLEKNQITHVLSIHDDAKEGRNNNIKYLCIKASDTANQDIQQYFTNCIDFIHSARLEGGNVLVHCLAGVSRSTTIVIAYVMTVTDLSWVDAMNAVRGARRVANPNFGFQRQLQNYEHTRLNTEKSNLIKKYGQLNDKNDIEFVNTSLATYNERQQLLTKNSNQSLDHYPLPHNAYNLDDNMEKKFRLTRALFEKQKQKEEENLDKNKLKIDTRSDDSGDSSTKTTTTTTTSNVEEEKTFDELNKSFDHLEIDHPHAHQHVANKFFDTSE